MPADSNDIWQYTETESASLVSTLLNRLASTVSSKVQQFANRFVAIEAITNRNRIRQAYVNFGATGSGIELTNIGIPRGGTTQRAHVTIAGVLTPALAGQVGIDTSIDSPGAAYIAVNHRAQAVANTPLLFTDTRTYDIPAGSGTVLIRFLTAMVAGSTATGNFTMTVQLYGPTEI